MADFINPRKEGNNGLRLQILILLSQMLQDEELQGEAAVLRCHREALIQDGEDRLELIF